MNARNKSRARRCQAALRTYGHEFEIRTHLIDFMTDARHWCDQHGECYRDLDRMADEHYRAEV